MRPHESKTFSLKLKNRTSIFALTDGGTAGLIWGYLIVWVGYMLVFISIAEMTSMYVGEVIFNMSDLVR
jgi:hypothetical protein